MKKLFLLLFLFASLATIAQPIAVKPIGVDSVTGLNQQLVVWQLTIDSKSEIVVVVYNIETLSPNGKVVSTSENKTYTRYNRKESMRQDSTIIPANLKFTELRNSPVGQMISGMIANDVKVLNSIADLKLLDQQ